MKFILTTFLIINCGLALAALAEDTSSEVYMLYGINGAGQQERALLPNGQESQDKGKKFKPPTN